MNNLFTALKAQSFVLAQTVTHFNTFLYNSYCALVGGLFVRGAQSQNVPDFIPSVFLTSFKIHNKQ